MMTAPRPSLRSRSRRGRRERGTILIVAMMFCGLVGIALASHLRLGQSTLTTSDRAFYQNAAINLAETGLEHAMWSINKSVAGDPNAWSAWTKSGSKAYTTLPGFAYDQKATGSVRIYVENYTGALAPRVVARATITLARGPAIEKWIEVTLRKRSRFANGLVARNSLVFRGNNATVDSWNSDPDNLPGTAAIPFGAGVRHDAGTAASISVSVSSVLINNADIWGYVATGGAAPSVGVNGSVLGSDSGPGARVDPERISTDFTANLDPVSAPTGKTITVLGGMNSSQSLPGTGDTRDADGKYYYQISGISLTNKILSITSGDVVVIVPSGYNIKVGGGSGAVTIANGASLAIYAAGDVAIGGQGITNGNPGGNGTLEVGELQQPIKFQLWGSASDPDGDAATTHQDIDIKGNGALSGVVYAPNAHVFINGNGDVQGSIVGGNITLVGNAAFHYDESLGIVDTGNPFGITRWRELTSAADRAAYVSELSF